MKLKIILLAIQLIILQDVFAADLYKATSDLNIRTGPGKGYPVSYTLKKGDEVLLITKEVNWYKIEYLGTTGYSSSKYLKFSRTVQNSKKSANSEGQFLFTILAIALVILAFITFLIVFRKNRDNILLESVTYKNRGTVSERYLVMMLLKAGISNRYIFHDLYVEKSKGEFSQSDVVLLTRVGIIVIEVKDYNGWIFGSGNNSQWTKVMAYGKKKFYFYNPIKQNSNHVVELRRKLDQFREIPFYSIIVFFGECELKSINFVPKGTYVVKSQRILEVISDILNENNQYTYTNEDEVIRILREAVTNGGIIKNQIKHSNNIEDMLGTNRVYD